MENRVTRPALRYHGGKWILAPWIIKHFPPHRVHVELFAGGASVLLRKPRSYAEVYNDLDGEVVNVFKQLRDHGSELREMLVLTPFAREEYEGAYTPTLDDLERARRTVIKSFMGFGSDAIRRLSGFRSNSNRSGTTPAHDWDSYTQLLPKLTERLRGVVIENRDYAAIVKQHDQPSTLFYVDPPYMHATRTGSKRYTEEMTDADHGEMAAVLHAIRGKVVLSGYDSPQYNHAFSDWQRIEKMTLADRALERKEVLWCNFELGRLELFDRLHEASSSNSGLAGQSAPDANSKAGGGGNDEL